MTGCLATAGNSRFAICAASLATLMSAGPAQGQDARPANLPRPGYDYEGIRALDGWLLVDADAQVDLVSNLFLTSQDEAEDVRAVLSPRITYLRVLGNGSLEAEAHAALTRHANNPLENSTTFGTSVTVGISPSQGHNLTGVVAYNRNVEGRADPETRAGPTDPPREIDVILGELRYREASGKIRWQVEAGTERYDLLTLQENDRDQQAYRASLRLGYRIIPSTNLFVESFVNRRDFRLPFDFGGIDRDQNTFAVVVGARRELGNRLRGTFSIGAFQTDPDDQAIEPYTGLRLFGNVVWTPRQRTAISFNLARGDVATVRSGATTRIDTIARVSVNQEIRHNILGSLSASYVETQYRGESRGKLRNTGATARVEYLFNRRTSAFAEAQYETRNAIAAIDQFDNARLTFGIRQSF